MKIAHINLSDSSGGAANAVMRLHDSFLLLGIDSTVYIMRSSGMNSPNIIKPNFFERQFFSKIRYILSRSITRNANKKRGLFSADFGSSSIVSANYFADYDAIYLHWINHGMMSLSAIENILKLNRPVFWVCHDMWPITGGCHHSLDCDNFKTHCHRCPSLNSRKNKDLSYYIFEKKGEIYNKYPNLHFIAISEFMSKVISNSALSKKHIKHLIPNAINLNVFLPKDTLECRKKLALPIDKKLVLFGADMGFRNPYKGWVYVKEAILKLKENHGDKIELVVFGADLDANSNMENELQIKIHFMGKISQPKDMAMLYNSVDVYLNPSIAESLSYTTMESVACGTRCVAFNIGGIPTIINHLHNGYLADFGSVGQLVQGVEWCLKEGRSLSIQQVCYESINGKFDMNTIGFKHFELLNATIKY